MDAIVVESDSQQWFLVGACSASNKLFVTSSVDNFERREVFTTVEGL
jgi:hypothetical protein